MTTPLPKPLWDHQLASWHQAKVQFSNGARSVLIQKPTGTGKTRLVGAMTHASTAKPSRQDRSRKNRVWFVVPKKELLWQASEEFSDWVPAHGKIGDGREEGDFQTHVVSSGTLINRMRAEKIKNPADLVIFDEAHVFLDRQLEIKSLMDPLTAFIGLTATPQRLDGRPLKTSVDKNGVTSGMYDCAVMDEQMQWYVENGYLKQPMLYGLPTDIYQGAEFTKQGDLRKNSVEHVAALQKARAKGGFIFGDSIDHYGDLSQGRTFLDFCQSVAEAEVKADEWRRKGFKVESIDGTMTNAKRKALIKAIETGELIGLTARDLPTYGLDVPNISCVLLNRKTQSLALLYQMLGRASRWDENEDKYHIHDFVGNCDDPAKGGHGHPLTPRKWNFDGSVKRKKIPEDAVESIEAVGKCPVCWDLIIKRVQCSCGEIMDVGEVCDCESSKREFIMACRSCGAQKDVKHRKPMRQLDGMLVEITGPTIMKDRPPENQREFQFRIKDAIARFQAKWYGTINGDTVGVIDSQAVRDLLQVSYELKWKRGEMQVYHKMCRPDDSIVNVSLLQEIAEIEIPDVKKKYHPKWVTRKREILEDKFKKGHSPKTRPN